MQLITVEQGTTASADPDDLILVQRGDTLYQAKVSDLPSGPTSPPSNVAIELKQDSVNANRFTSNSFTTEITGDDIEAVELKGEVTGALGLEAATLPITNNVYSGTDSTEVVLTLVDDSNLDGTTFAVNDVVKSRSYTPTTSTIKTVISGVIDYSSYLVQPDQTATSSFDGNLTSYSYPTAPNSVWTWEYTPTLTYSTIKVYTSYTGTKGGSPSVKVNGVEVLDIVPDYTGDALFLDETALAAKGVISPLRSIEIVSSSAAGNTAVLQGVEINGNLLVDNEGNAQILTFAGDASTNPDLKLFQTGDVVAYETISQPVQTYTAYNTPHLGRVDTNQPTTTPTGGTATCARRVPTQTFAEMTKQDEETVNTGSRPSNGGSAFILLADMGQDIAHLSFVRYPGEAGSDGSSFALYGAKKENDEWVFLKSIKRIGVDTSNPNIILTSGDIPYRYFAVTYDKNTIAQNKYGVLDGAEVDYTTDIKVISSDVAATLYCKRR